MNILYVGSLEKYGKSNTCTHRCDALKNLGFIVHEISTFPKEISLFQWLQFRTINKLYKLGIRLNLPDLGNANKNVVRLIPKEGFDIIWIDKGVTITLQTLQFIKKNNPETLIVGYSPDDMMNPGNQSTNLVNSYKCYDIFFTTKSYNVQELKQQGLKNVIFIGNAYNRNFHKPIKLSKAQLEKYRSDIGFIGSFEDERANSILYLANNGFHVNVWGQGWERVPKHANLTIYPFNIYDDYSAVLCACKINLCFLRKVNRDLQTTRTMEIPATGSFMLAERTPEHLELFIEGEEAEFFSSNEELLRKCQYYLLNPKARERIAQNGLVRCNLSNYSNEGRMKIMLNEIDKLKKMQNSIFNVSNIQKT